MALNQQSVRKRQLLFGSKEFMRQERKIYNEVNTSTTEDIVLFTLGDRPAIFKPFNCFTFIYARGQFKVISIHK